VGGASVELSIQTSEEVERRNSWCVVLSNAFSHREDPCHQVDCKAISK